MAPGDGPTTMTHRKKQRAGLLRNAESKAQGVKWFSGLETPVAHWLARVTRHMDIHGILHERKLPGKPLSGAGNTEVVIARYVVPHAPVIDDCKYSQSKWRERGCEQRSQVLRSRGEHARGAVVKTSSGIVAI